MSSAIGIYQQAYKERRTSNQQYNKRKVHVERMFLFFTFFSIQQKNFINCASRTCLKVCSRFQAIQKHEPNHKSLVNTYQCEPHVRMTTKNGQPTSTTQI